ncbi:MAG: hypothetical protein KDE54_37920 [Caldilineaceae bacterium]|nr:hypothetical protein [Caldilineaceae bacterium]MCB0094569.1 hypothetical protein [Caldilineaceae bacterium]
MLPSFPDYAAFLVSLPEHYAAIQSSTLHTFTIGPLSAEVEGTVTFPGGYVLDIWELIDLENGTIRYYSYELEKNGERVWWYDPQAHPNDPSLASTHPHHKHVHPDIKHNRIPAPGLSFSGPNLPFLIEEIIQLLAE